MLQIIIISLKMRVTLRMEYEIVKLGGLK